MSTAPRIDELRKKFEENPRRYFAPLANELRKTGDVAQAILLCREHLPKQPGHMSGYIVFGQALFDAGELAESRAVFEQALGLDPENLIALRQLGDIARRDGDISLARRWYERVLEADPRNDEIAAQLSALVTPISVAPIASATPVTMTPVYAAPAVPSPIDFLPSVPTPVTPYEPIPTPIASHEPVLTPIVAHEAVLTPVVAHEAFYTPVAVPVVPTPAMPTPAMPTPAIPVSTIPTPPMPIDSIEAAVLTPTELDEALPSLSDLEPSAVVLDDPFVFGDAEAPTAHGDDAQDVAVADFDDAAEAIDESFEEGLVAPTWPDTSDLATRSLTPRSATPLSVPVPPDVAAAFGQLPDERDAIALPEPEPDLPIDFDLVASSPELPSMTIAAAEPVEAERMEAEPIEAVSSDAVPGVVDAFADSSDDVSDDVTEELPWIAEPVRPQSAEVEAIVEAIAEDARASGEPDDVQVFAMPEPRHTPVHPPVIESFADVMDSDADEDAVAPQSLVTDVGDSAFVTETMGELLLAQGFTDRAITVYEELVRRQPENVVLAARLESLRAAHDADAERSATATPPYAGTPVYAATPVQSLTPMPSLTPVRSLTPMASQTPAYVTAEHAAEHANEYATGDVAAFATPQRTARAFFAALAARRVERRAPTPVVASTALTVDETTAEPAPVSAASRTAFRTPAPSDSLAALFGADSTAGDDGAARDFAAAFSDDTAPTDGRGLFSGAFASVPTPASAPAVATPPVATPAVTAPATASPTATDPFSFDRFFPDPALATPGSTTGTPPAPLRPPQATPGAAPTTPSGEAQAVDDLAQFTAWLKGLGAP